MIETLFGSQNVCIMVRCLCLYVYKYKVGIIPMVYFSEKENDNFTSRVAFIANAVFFSILSISFKNTIQWINQWYKRKNAIRFMSSCDILLNIFFPHS